MSIEKITKRSGEVVDFDQAKIERAMLKAFAAVDTPIDSEGLSALADRVETELDGRFEADAVPSVEVVQDVVERAIAEAGYFDVAKAYIIYRFKHKEQREHEQAETVEKAKSQELMVQKRDGSRATFDVNEITSFLVNCAGDQREDIDFDAVVQDAIANVFDNITTSEINQALAMALKARIEEDPAYSDVAARVLLNDLYKEVLGTDEFSPGFAEEYRAGLAACIEKGVADERYDARLKDLDLDELAQEIQPSRDHLFEYMGAQVLYDRYFQKDLEQNFLEIPQFFWMRIAMGLALAEKPEEQVDRAREFYHTISQLYYVPSTPTLFHAGTTHPQMSSCYLTTVDDTLEQIFKSYADNAQLSKWSGGLGNDWTNIRGTGALIKSTNVGSQGVIPFLKIADATTAAINRSGKRRGATCAYLETWHYDIEDFLELRKNTGDDRRRTHDMNTANWIPDLFMKRVMADGEWTLFSPDETPDLHELYGKKFEARYEEYEKMADEGKIHLHKRMPAKQLWRKMITMLFETGHPWMTFKDPCNVRSPQDHVGVVHSSNLCTEITLNTSADETAVCNLGSVNLLRHIGDGAINKERMEHTVRTAVRMLDNVIDLNFYPTKEAKDANMRHRPVGLGVMGLQDALYTLGLSFDSEAAVTLSDETQEFIAYYALLTSSELAAERGQYESYKGSKWDRDLLPLDTLKLLEDERGIETGVPKTTTLDWAPVRESIKQHGMRNSNTMAIAPTATIANISGVFPSIEPIYKNVYVKSNFSGEFTVNNPYLIEDLKSRGLWTQEMSDQLKASDGSVQDIPEMPADLKEKYKEVFEIDSIWVIKHAAARGKWIDQSQSINIFINTTEGKVISEAYANAWRMGLKTTYYLRSLGASAIEKSTLDITKQRRLSATANDAPAPETAPVAEAPAAQPEPVPAPVVAPATEPVREPVAAIKVEPTRPKAGPKVFIAQDAICEACE